MNIEQIRETSEQELQKKIDADIEHFMNSGRHEPAATSRNDLAVKKIMESLPEGIEIVAYTPGILRINGPTGGYEFALKSCKWRPKNGKIWYRSKGWDDFVKRFVLKADAFF